MIEGSVARVYDNFQLVRIRAKKRHSMQFLRPRQVAIFSQAGNTFF